MSAVPLMFLTNCLFAEMTLDEVIDNAVPICMAADRVDDPEDFWAAVCAALSDMPEPLGARYGIEVKARAQKFYRNDEESRRANTKATRRALEEIMAGIKAF